MLSDGSMSDKSSPITRRRRSKKQRVSSCSEESADDVRHVKRRKTSQAARVFCSDDSSDNETPMKPARGLRFVVPSSSDSSDSDIPGPSRRNIFRAISESEDSDASSSTESDGIRRPWLAKEGNGKRKLVLSDSESTSDSEVERLTTQGTGKDEAGASSDSDGGERCIICFKTLGVPYANPSNCSHSFHEECLSTWSKTSNTCPIDRVKYTSIHVHGADGTVIHKRNVTTPPPQDHNPDLEPDDPTFCEVCNQHDREGVMLLCDRCEAGYHMDCLTPPLTQVPSGDWFCPNCSNLGNVSISSSLSDISAMDIILLDFLDFLDSSYP